MRRVVRFRLYLVTALCGAIFMALEILASRILAPHFGNSVYVWGSLISVFLAALSIGYSWGGGLADRHPNIKILGRIVLFVGFWMLALRIWGPQLSKVLANMTGASPMGTLLAATVLFGVPSLLLGTASPFVIRVAARDLDRIGNTAGRLYALSTVGSLAGTLLCTFVAIPRWPVSGILGALAASTGATALVALGRVRLESPAAALLVVAPFFLGSPVGSSSSGVLAVRSTPYQTLEVYEEAGYRYLRGDGVTQSAIQGDGEPASRYIHYSPAAALLQPQIKSVLAIGMGGGLLSKTLRQVLPEVTLDYAEIDPAVPEVAEKFGFWTPSALDRLHIGDGRQFLQRSGGQWDYIYVDAYIGLAVPFQLTTREFFAEVAGHLNPGGVLGVNLAAGLRDPFSRSLLFTLRNSFSTSYVVRVRGTSNVLLLATKSPRVSNVSLAERAEAFDHQSLPIPLETIAADFLEWEFESVDLVELSDDFAPAEHLVLLGERNFDLAVLDTR